MFYTAPIKHYTVNLHRKCYHLFCLSLCTMCFCNSADFPNAGSIKSFHSILFYSVHIPASSPSTLSHQPYFRDPSALLRQVHGDKDPDGFYRGECGGRLGYVPCNMVSEIQVDDEETRQQLLLQGFLSTAAAAMEKIGRFRPANQRSERTAVV